jgi:hypothetical protein
VIGCDECTDRQIKKTDEGVIRQFVQKVVSREACEKYVEYVRSQMERLVENIQVEPLCMKFYYKDCKGCIFQPFHWWKEKGCVRFFRVKYGENTSRAANTARVRIYS